MESLGAFILRASRASVILIRGFQYGKIVLFLRHFRADSEHICRFRYARRREPSGRKPNT